MMMPRQLTGITVVLALAGLALPAQASAVRCQIGASPETPSASAEAFAPQDVHFSTTVLVQCFDASDAPVAADQVCLSARRDEFSGTTDFLREDRTVAYEVSANGVLITALEQQVWSGAVEASGKTLNLDYDVRRDDFVGFPAGPYYASTTWTSHRDVEVCG